MRRPPVTTALAASALVMLTLSAGASSAPKPRRSVCDATPGGGATTLVTSKPLSIRIRVGLPTNIDMRDVPKVPEAAPSTEPAAEMPSPGIVRAKKLKSVAPTCIPQAAPLPGPPTPR